MSGMMFFKTGMDRGHDWKDEMPMIFKASIQSARLEGVIHSIFRRVVADAVIASCSATHFLTA